MANGYIEREIQAFLFYDSRLKLWMIEIHINLFLTQRASTKNSVYST
jgi:hypothetical protein